MNRADTSALRCQGLQRAGALQLQPEVALNVIMGLRPSVVDDSDDGAIHDAFEQYSRPRISWPRWSVKCYDALLLLDKAGSLTFTLVDVVRDLVEVLKRGAIESVLFSCEASFVSH